MKLDINNETLRTIGRIADRENAEAYVVGGYVRDKLLGKEVTDIDIVVVGDGVALARTIGKEFSSNVVVFEKRQEPITSTF